MHITPRNNCSKENFPLQCATCCKKVWHGNPVSPIEKIKTINLISEIVVTLHQNISHMPKDKVLHKKTLYTKPGIKFCHPAHSNKLLCYHNSSHVHKHTCTRLSFRLPNFMNDLSVRRVPKNKLLGIILAFLCTRAQLQRVLAMVTDCRTY